MALAPPPRHVSSWVTRTDDIQTNIFFVLMSCTFLARRTLTRTLHGTARHDTTRPRRVRPRGKRSSPPRMSHQEWRMKPTSTYTRTEYYYNSMYGTTSPTPPRLSVGLSALARLRILFSRVETTTPPPFHCVCGSWVAKRKRRKRKNDLSL